MKIAIYGYGTLGQAVCLSVRRSSDVSLYGIFSRRTEKTTKTANGVSLFPASEITDHKKNFDVLILCAGSANDLPILTPKLVRDFEVVDSFDNHAGMIAHFRAVQNEAKRFGHLALIGGGWDPGLFSIVRLLFETVLPNGTTSTFWGPGVSQGHSEAVRRLPGVLNAKAFTVPSETQLANAKAGEDTGTDATALHRRICYVVPAPHADLHDLRQRISSLPHYFEGYRTDVIFLTEEELQRKYGGYPHGGCVIRNGKTGEENSHAQSAAFSLRLDSNPEFTANVLVACARAVYRQRQRGNIGCITVFNVAPSDFAPFSLTESLRFL